jgi:hypothetical protein
LHNQKGNEEEENSSHHFNNFNTFVNLEMKSETFIFSLLLVNLKNMLREREREREIEP